MDKAIEVLLKDLEAADTVRIEKQAKVVNLRKTLVNCKLKAPSRKEDEMKVVLRNGKYYQNWSTPCSKFMKRFQPEKDNPERLYREIR